MAPLSPIHKQQRISIGIEGNVGAGKTSLCRQLRAAMRCSIVPEYMEIIRKDRLRRIGSLSQSERFGLFRHLHFIREAIYQCQDRIIYDRTFLSILAHEYATFDSRCQMLPDYVMYALDNIYTEEYIVYSISRKN